MATCSTNVWRSKEFTATTVPVKIGVRGNITTPGCSSTNVTVMPPPSHELDVIQRMSEAWRNYKNNGTSKEN